MSATRILVSWIGHADLSAMADELGEAGKRLLAEARIAGKYGERPGPLKTAVAQGNFDEVHLLSNYPDVLQKPFAKWLGGKPTIHSVELTDPTDYDGIFRCANRVLTEVTKIHQRNDAKLSILLSPGTPAMAVVWVLLGKSRYPATFYQTNRGKLYETRIPAALFEEVVPELLRDRDIAWQHLAAKNPADVEGFERIVGDSPALRVAVGRAQRAALRDVPVLLLGESGTGKEMFAQAIHAASRRKTGPFEAINCAAIPRELLEAELFGHVKGAFTGADKDRDGAFSRSDRGTLFLDEIGECEPQLQSKLLRVLQPPVDKGPCYREFRPVGGPKVVTSDVRIVAATNRDLQKQIKAGLFREDLYYRLNVITLELPPLRERRSDIPVLAETFLERINKDFALQEPGYRYKTISDSTKRFMTQFSWPGNARQLYNTILQAAVMAENDTIDRRDLTSAVGTLNDDPTTNLLEQSLGSGFNLEDHLNSIRRHYLRRAMEESRGNKTKAAQLLGLNHYQTLDAQIERLKVEWSRPDNAR